MCSIWGQLHYHHHHVQFCDVCLRRMQNLIRWFYSCGYFKLYLISECSFHVQKLIFDFFVIAHWQRKTVPPPLFRYVFISFYLHWISAALLMFLLEITKYKLMNFFLTRKKLNTENKIVHKRVCMLGVSGLCLNKQWNFPAFLFPYLFFCLCCFLSIAMHHLTLPKQVWAAAHQLKAIWSGAQLPGG